MESPEENRESMAEERETAEPRGEETEAEAARPEDGGAPDGPAASGEPGETERRLKATIDRLKHLQADFENYKKRVARERQEQVRLAEDELLRGMLPVYDGLERAFAAYQGNGDKEAFIEGIERIFSQFNEFLRKQTVHDIEAEGERFDPTRHEALISVEDEGEPNRILEVFERGYVREERVLRPSRVKVSRRVIPSEPSDEAAPAPDEPVEEEGD